MKKVILTIALYITALVCHAQRSENKSMRLCEYILSAKTLYCSAICHIDDTAVRNLYLSQVNDYALNALLFDSLCVNKYVEQGVTADEREGIKTFMLFLYQQSAPDNKYPILNTEADVKSMVAKCDRMQRILAPAFSKLMK